MKRIRNIRIPLLAMALFMVVALVSERYLLSDRNGVQSIENFCEGFRNKQILTREVLSEIAAKLDTADYNHPMEPFGELADLDDFHKENDISVLVGKDKRLLFWTDNVGCFPMEVFSAGEGILSLPNGWYYHIHQTVGNYSLDGLILIKYKYTLKNQYLKNRFAKGFYFPRRFEVLARPEKGSYPVLDVDNQYAFSVKPAGTINSKHTLLLIPSVLFLLAFICLLIILYRLNIQLMRNRPMLKSAILLVLLLALYFVMNKFRVPESVYLIKLFSPQDFAFTSYWTSLGELLLFVSVILFWAISFHRTFDLSESIKKDKRKRRIAITLFFLFLAAYFVFVRYMMYCLVMNSSVSFALYRVEDITVNSFTGYLAIGMLLLSFLILSLKAAKLFQRVSPVKEYTVMASLVFLVGFALCFLVDRSGFCRLSFFYIIFLLLPVLMNRKGLPSQRVMMLVTYVLVCTLFVVANMPRFINHYEKQIQQTMALNLSEEHDPTAELLLKDMDQKMAADSVLSKAFFSDAELVREYLQRRYFGGYFREYDLQVTLCGEKDSLIIQPEEKTCSCVAFFDEMVEKDGTPLLGTHFYFMENTTGRISYFGRFIFTSEGTLTHHVFIELSSKLLSEGVGFPELLLPLASVENRMKSNFSYAKYYAGELVDRGGNYAYTFSIDEYDVDEKYMAYISWDGLEHFIYRYSDDGVVIVSREPVRLMNFLVLFPYVFVLFFLVGLLFNVFSGSIPIFTFRQNTLRGKIQLAIVGIVFVVLLVIGGGTIYYIIANYRKNYQRGLLDKINAVSAELDPVIQKADPASYNHGYLEYELIRLSDIFQTDVNYYDLSGILVAASRPEVYDKGLISPVMNPQAYRQMSNPRATSFLQHECIGGMEFLSAYVPVYYENGNIAGYLNLPYFTREKAFRQEVTTFILAFVNIYVFLLLISIFAAYFISLGITGPLEMIRKHLRGVQFGKNPTPIRYRSDDEVGILVAEYNRKVEELAESAQMLARSERESAWREMARQIAHEIKNPLTPMKLNIQFLQRTDPKSDRYPELLTRVTRTLIEQIDNLSAIASEFSNFAKIPSAHNERFNLSQRIEEIVPLFDHTSECRVETFFKGAGDVEVYADKEQFSRAIINLVKNAIQAIPGGRKGKVIITVENEGKSALVKVTDNGKGIPEDLYESIFVPNFTTKTSGTGLGLAITKSIVENFNGEIWFSSVPNEGTTFFIRMPMAH